MPKHLSSNDFSQPFAITSRRVVTSDGERCCAVLIEGEKVRAIVGVDEIPSGVSVIDYGDLVVSPGVVDAHVHINEPGRTEWEGFTSATKSAAAGGVTTIIDMPLNSSPVTTSVEALKAKRRAAAGKVHVDVGFYAGLVPGNLSELAGMIEAGVFGVKAFMCDSGLEEFPAAGVTDLREAMEVLTGSGSGIPLLAHAELVDDSAPKPSDSRSYAQYADSRPPIFELNAIKALIELCGEFKTPVHVVHLATGLALPALVMAKHRGLPITVETCPHYLYFNSEAIADGATSFKCAPPIRDQANRDLLCDAVAEGIIETIGSDHSPTLPELKSLDSGDFSTAWGGIAGLQLTLPVLCSVGKSRGWSVEMIANRLSKRPAEIFGLGDRKGKIEVGYDADFVVWNPDEKFTVSGAALFHRHAVTPYEGSELFGVVNATYVRGRRVFAEDVESEPVGSLLVRGESASKSISGFFNGLDVKNRATEFQKCCASKAWIEAMLQGGEFESDFDLISHANESWKGLAEQDYLEAFTAHPRIGDVETLRAKFSNTKAIAKGEQSGVESADEKVIGRLAVANDEYFEKFGFIFIVCATGKSAGEMLEILESRLPNERGREIEVAAAEQMKITRIRLRKLSK